MPLENYKKKRDFAKTPEPEGKVVPTQLRRFVIQEHHATRLHFDLRLEMDGVLKSWAVPRGPSLDPKDKRLAVMTEDHPLEYLTFRGHIEEGNYGAGDMEIWDSGDYELKEPDDPVKGAENGKLVVRLHGEKIGGDFHMVRMAKGDGRNWLLIKGKDEFVDPDWQLEQVLEGGSRKDREKLLAARGESPMEPAVRQAAKNSDLSAVPGAIEAEMPANVSPMLARLVDEPFESDEWLFEIKWDGYRTICYIDGDSLTLMSRNNKPLTDRFPMLSEIRDKIRAKRAIIDGEIVAVDESGTPRFQLLQNSTAFTRWGKKRKVQPVKHAHVLVYAFDLIYLDGYDLRNTPLSERKRLLKEIVQPSDRLLFSDHVVGKGVDLYNHAEESEIEGIIAKKADSTYTESRSHCWLKIKTARRQEFVIGGYTEPRKSRSHFGSIIIGTYKDGKLVYAGLVGGGFDEKTLSELHEIIRALETDECPFGEIQKTDTRAHWIKPELVCEVKFAEWTDEGVLRHPIFLGLREDKPAKEVKPEAELDTDAEVKEASTSPKPKPRSKRAGSSQVQASELFSQDELKGDHEVVANGQVVRLTNLQKVYWPEDGFTKGDLLRYYFEMSEPVLAHLRGRPLILRRYPNGIHEPDFYQHNLDEAPEWVSRWVLEEDDKKISYGRAETVADLLYIVNLGTIAQNPWLSRIKSPGSPDFVVLDLDPHEADFGTVCRGALAVKDILDQIGLESFAKTSGSRGIHIYIPIKAAYDYAQTYSFGEVIAAIAAKRHPDILTDERMKRKRGSGRVYVDYMQNAVGKSVASPYSVRAAVGATVSAPLTWDEVRSMPKLSDFSIKNMRKRLDDVGELFADVLTRHQSLAKAVGELDSVLTEAPETLDADAKKRRRKALSR